MDGNAKRFARRLLSAGSAAMLLFAFGWTDAGLAQERQLREVQRQARASAAEPEYVEGRVIVKYRPGVSSAVTVGMHASIGAEVLKRLNIIDADVVELRPGMSVEDGIAWYAAQPSVEYAEPDFIVHIIDGPGAPQDIGPTLTPNDPMYPDMWGLNNTGQTGGTPDADIDAPEAWDITTGGSVVIGVIDSGVDTGHEDLADNIWTNPGETPGNGVDDDGNGYIDDINGWDFVNDDNDPFDDNSHGTHVSGTIAAVGNNGIGITGVAWQAEIMGLKFLDADGFGSTSGAIEAVEYATNNGADLTNNSWGGGGFSQALRDAIEASGDAGMLFMAAAGNSGTDNDISPHYPSNYTLDNIISVAATDHNDAKAGFSNFGATSVDLGAPGVNILSTVPGDGYSGTFSGTSMATPHVAGVAALIRAQYPSLTHLQVRDRILASGDAVASLDGITVTGRRLNAFNALEDDATAPDAVSDLAVVPDAAGTIGAAGAFSLSLEWTATGDDGSTGTASAYDLRYSTSPIDAGNFDLATEATGEPKPGAPGTTETFTVTGLDPTTDYYFALKVLDNVGNASGLSNVAQGMTDNVRTIFFDDAETAESDSKWTADVPWARTDEDASPDGEPVGLGGTFSWTDSPGGLYSNDTDASIVSIAFSLADAVNSTLLFDHRYQIEQGFDFGHVDISTDGSTWTNLATYTGTSASWTTEQFDLSAYDGEPSVQIRFRLVTDFIVVADGWHIDDILVGAEAGTQLIVESPNPPLGDPAVLGTFLDNQEEVAGIDWSIVFDDPLGLISYTSSSTTDRTAGWTLDAQFDDPSNTLTSVLVEPGGGTLAADTGRVAEHNFTTTVPVDIVDWPLSNVEVDAPSDPSTGMPDIYSPVEATLSSFNISDVGGNPVTATGQGGVIKLGLLNADVDLSFGVDVADIVAMIDFFLGRIGFTDLQFLLADTYKDDQINVIDIVRGVNIILGRPIGTSVEPDLLALDVTDGNRRQASALEGQAIFSVTPSHARADLESPWLDLVAEVPENVVGVQVTVRYDPARVDLFNESLLLDEDEFQLAVRHGNGLATYMIYSPENRMLEPGERKLVRLRAERTSLDEESGVRAEEVELVRAIAADAEGGLVGTNVSVPLTRGEPLVFELGLNYPNPFTKATGTRVHLTVPTLDAATRPDSRVTVRIYSLRGTLVRTLVDRDLPGGRYSVSWDGTNDNGATVNSGIYLLMMKAGDFVERRRLVFIR